MQYSDLIFSDNANSADCARSVFMGYVSRLDQSDEHIDFEN